MMIEIYALIDPETKEIRYIGKANDSSKRLKSHIRDSKRRNTQVYCWIKSLAKRGLCPIIQVLKTVPGSEWKKTEIELIAFYKSQSAKLLNVAIGGDEPFCSKEVRAKNGRVNSLKIHSNTQAKRLWYLKKRLGDNLRFLLKNGKIESYNRIINKLKMGGVIYG